MSTKSMKAEEKPEKTEAQEEKSASMLGSCQTPEENAEPKQADGKQITPVMTEEEASNLLARLQDILSLWQGSDNRIIGGYVMTAFPIPEVMTIGKVSNSDGHGKVFTVNDTPVTALDKS